MAWDDLAFKVSWRLLILVLVVGFFVGLATGLVENNTETLGLYENKYYGFPLAWRSIYNGELTVYYDALLADIVFGVVIAAIMFAVAMKTIKLMEKKVPPKTVK